jgi:hypothetical protein
MNFSPQAFTTFAAGCAVVAALFAWGNPLLAMAAAGWDRAAFADFERGVTAITTAPRVALLRASMIADMAGFYLLLLPLAVAIYARFAPAWGPWALLGTVAGIAYLLFGGAGAAVLAASAGLLLPPRRTAGGKELYLALVEAVGRGIWTILNPFLAGTWWLLMGIMLWSEETLLASFVLLVGGTTFLRAVRIPVVFVPADAIYLLLAPPAMAATGIWLAFG